MKSDRHQQPPGIPPPLSDAERRVVQLISLKRYEREDPFLATRVRAQVRERILLWEQRATAATGLRGLWTTPGAAVLRFTLAGAFVALLLAQFLVVPTLPRLEPMRINGMAGGSSQRDFQLAAPAATNGSEAGRALSENEPLLILSNQTPGWIQYGPGPSRLVNFEY